MFLPYVCYNRLDINTACEYYNGLGFLEKNNFFFLFIN